jgi:uncharacterized protein YraI
MIHKKVFIPFCLLALTLVVVSGCGRFFGPEEAAETAPAPTIAAVPTFTPTAEPPDGVGENATEPPVEVAASSTATAIEAPERAAGDEAAAAQPTQAPVTIATLMAATAAAESAPESASESATEFPSEESSASSAGSAADAPTDPYVVVAAEIINVRSGPGTNYDIIGSVASGDQLPITGRNEPGDWWQVCCFGDEQPGWLYGALLDVQQGERVAVAVDIPPAPTTAPTQAPVPEAVSEPTPAPAESVADEPAMEPTVAPAVEAQPDVHSSTAGIFDPDAQFHIVHYHVRGYEENNGGIFNNGGQHMIFITVLDENGAGIDGAVVKDALADDFSIVTGSKGPGKAEFEMFWEPYKLYVASIPSGPVTSQISNQMNTAKPHIPDIVGKLGPPENEYAICPTVDDRCEPPFFHAHWSYEITFQKVK